MPTYEYECQACGQRFERRQTISDPPVAACPTCQGEVRRLVSGGAGFILAKGARHSPRGRGGDHCGFDQAGTTCCGRQERCDRPPCERER
jgi:putative FmdB family regulatory protein